jgi:uncharacterized protein
LVSGCAKMLKATAIMLRNTFIHLPGIGRKSEQTIWSQEIFCWDDLLGRGLSGFSPAKRDALKHCLEESHDHLLACNPYFFRDRLPSNQHWRLFPDFKESTAYLDIETTGLDCSPGRVTTVAVYDGSSIFTYVRGQNLNQFAEDIQRYKVLVTYNGKCFDIPFLQKEFGIRLDQVHIDLRFALRSVGYTGGLKACERKACIDRGDLQGVDGACAVLLWEDYRDGENEAALETLLAYNVQDALNLEALVTLCYNLKLAETPFRQTQEMAIPFSPANPFKVDLRAIEAAKERIASIRWP